jgi:hypothetical protein
MVKARFEYKNYSNLLYLWGHKMRICIENLPECEFTKRRIVYRSSELIAVLKIPSFPCLDKIGPGGGIKNILWR